MFVKHKLTKGLFKITDNENLYPGKKHIVTRYVNHVHSWIQIKNRFPLGEKCEWLCNITT